METETFKPQPTAFLRLCDRLLGWLAPLLIAVTCSDLLQGLDVMGKGFIKPRDFTLGLSIACLGLALMLRPRFSPTVLLMTLVPFWRFFDSAFIRRYIPVEDPSALTMRSSVVLLFVLVVVAVAATERGKQHLVNAAIGIIIITAIGVFIEFMGMAKFSAIIGRLAGFGSHPNCPGIYGNLALGVIFTLQPRFGRDMCLIGLSLAMMGPTLSRSAIALLAGITIVYLIIHGRKHLVGLMISAAIAIPLVSIGVVVLSTSALSQGTGKNTNVEERLKAILEFDTEKVGSPERLKDLMDAVEAIDKSPLIGTGTGYGTGGSPLMPHNQFVGLWLDHGILGPLLYAGLLIGLSVRCLLQRGNGAFCLIPLWGLAPASHNLTDTPAYWLALIAVGYALSAHRFGFRLSASPAPQVSPFTQVPTA